MNSEKKKFNFKLKLNAFDTVILGICVVIGIFLLWWISKPSATGQNTGTATSTVRFVVRFNKWNEGDSKLIQEGDIITDGIKNYTIGKVVSVQATPATTIILNQTTRKYELHTLPHYEDVLVTIETQGTYDARGVIVDNGYEVRVNSTVYGRGEGYMGIGPVISIERKASA